MATLKNTIVNDTGNLRLPSGTTAQRPGTPVVGDMRYNSTTGFAEVYTAGGWGTFGATPYFRAIEVGIMGLWWIMVK